MSLALQAVAPSDYFEFGPDCVLDGNYGACLHFKCREHRAKLVNHQRIVAVHQQMPTPLAHTHYEELDLKIGWRLPLTKHLKDSLLRILVLRRRTLRAFEPADHVFHLISFSANGLTDQNRLSLLLRGLAHPFRFPYTSSRPRAAALCAFSQGAHHGPKHMSVPGSAGCPRSRGAPTWVKGDFTRGKRGPPRLFHPEISRVPQVSPGLRDLGSYRQPTQRMVVRGFGPGPRFAKTGQNLGHPKIPTKCSSPELYFHPKRGPHRLGNVPSVPRFPLSQVSSVDADRSFVVPLASRCHILKVSVNIFFHVRRQISSLRIDQSVILFWRVPRGSRVLSTQICYVQLSVPLKFQPASAAPERTRQN